MAIEEKPVWGHLRVVIGQQSVTGSATVVTGLKRVVRCFAVTEANASINLYPGVTAVPSATAGSIDLKTWKPTSSANPTPIAATVATNVAWIAIGY